MRDKYTGSVVIYLAKRREIAVTVTNNNAAFSVVILKHHLTIKNTNVKHASLCTQVPVTLT